LIIDLRASSAAYGFGRALADDNTALFPVSDAKWTQRGPTVHDTVLETCPASATSARLSIVAFVMAAAGLWLLVLSETLPVGAQIESIAVMPFANQSGTPKSITSRMAWPRP
jgi:hypothetical protein